MTTCLLLFKNNETKEVFENEVEGYLFPRGFFTHKDKVRKIWVVSDFKSGLLIKEGFKTLQEAKRACDDSSLYNEILEKRKTTRYGNLLKIHDTLYKKHYSM